MFIYTANTKNDEFKISYTYIELYLLNLKLNTLFKSIYILIMVISAFASEPCLRSGRWPTTPRVCVHGESHSNRLAYDLCVVSVD